MTEVITYDAYPDASDLAVPLEETVYSHHTTMEHFLRSSSWFCGIVYAVLFGGSLAFQTFTNYFNKSTKGFSTDYALVGFVGFFFLVFNQTIGKIDPTTDAGRVHIMDLIFAQLALFFSSVAYTQTVIYPSHNSLTSTKVVMAFLLTAFFLFATVECAFGVPLKSYLFISLIDLAAFIKAGSSLIKYLFQIRENWINKSTQGVSKAAFWADFWGGAFCFAQLQIDSVVAGYPSFIADPQLNTAKVLIATFGLINTTIILIQIYCIYVDLPRQTMVHPDSTFGSDNYLDDIPLEQQQLVFEEWNELFMKEQAKELMLTYQNSQTNTTRVPSSSGSSSRSSSIGRTSQTSTDDNYSNAM